MKHLSQPSMDITPFPLFYHRRDLCVKTSRLTWSGARLVNVDANVVLFIGDGCLLIQSRTAEVSFSSSTSCP